MRPWDVYRRERRQRADLQEHERQLRRLRRQGDDAALALRRREQAQRDLQRRVDDLDRRGAGLDGRAADTRGRDLDDQLLVWVLPAAAAAALPLLIGHLSAMLAHGEWPRYPLHEAPGILARLIAHPGDPASAWEPVNAGGAVPGPVAWWGTFVVVAVIAGLVALLVWSATRRAPGRGSVASVPPATPATAPAWAAAASGRTLWLPREDTGRLVVGVAGGRKLAVRDRHSLLVVGPAHSGKTSGVTVPAVVEWRGPIVVASTKGHLIDETIGWRSRQGEVHVYDPAAVTRYHRSGWSLLAECGSWHGAIRTAADLTLAARAAIGDSDGGDGITVEGRGDLWRSSMAMSLAPFLLAAVASGRSIGVAAEWIEREERDEVLDVLQGVDREAARAHRMTFTRHDESRSRFLHAMHEILSVYEDPIVASSMDRHDIEPAELLDGANTLYLTAPEYDQDRLRPLCAMIVRRMLAAAYEMSASAGAPLDPPLLVVLDDVLGIAPIYDLAALASTGAARGVQIVSVFQDVAQIDDHYGDAADLVVKNHAAKLVLPSGPAVAARADHLLAPELQSDLHEGEAALLYRARQPMRLRLRPWYDDQELRRRVETPQDAVRPAEREDTTVPLAVAEQSAVWARRGSSGAEADEAGDATIPLDILDPRYVEVFGSLDEEAAPQNVTPLADQRRRRR